MRDDSGHSAWVRARITTATGKIVFILIWWLSWFAIRLSLGIIGVPTLELVAFSISWDFAFLIFGAQTFRARGEAVAPVRPWWQATGRVKASRRLGRLFAVFACILLIGSILGVAKGIYPPAEVPGLAGVVVEMVAVSAFYLNSAARLKRSGGGAPRPVKFARGGRFAA